MLKWNAVLVALAMVAALGMQAVSAIPPVITYQGRLTQTDGTPYTGSEPVKFTIYGGTGSQLWSSGFIDVTFEDGLFTVRLGDSPQPALTPDIFADTAVTLGITLDTNPEMTPRTRFSTQPYAYLASVADMAQSMAAGSVGSDKLAPPISLEVSSPQPVIGGSNSSTGHGVFGEAVYGQGVFGVSMDGNGVYGGSTNNNGVYGYTINGDCGVYGQNDNPSYQFACGVKGISTSGSGTGVFGNSTAGFGIAGTTNDGFGVYGASYTGEGVHAYTSSGDCAVYAQNDNAEDRFVSAVKGVNYGTSGTGVRGIGYRGVQGSSDLDNGVGVYGWSDLGTSACGVSGNSLTGFGVFGEGPTGIYGYAGAPTGQAIMGYGWGTSTEGVLGLADGIHASAVYGIASATSGDPAGVEGLCDYGDAVIGTSLYGTAMKALGTFVATGTKSAEVKLDDGTPIRLFSEEATEVYFADYGSAMLSGGRVHVDLDPRFLQTVTIDDLHPMMVFVQLEGDCKGVFVANKGTTGFDVVELQGGASNVPFSYRVVCKRKFYEDERLATREEASATNIRMMEAVWPEIIEEHREKAEEVTRLSRQAEEYRMERQKIDELEAEQKSGRKIQPLPPDGTH